MPVYIYLISVLLGMGGSTSSPDYSLQVVKKDTPVDEAITDTDMTASYASSSRGYTGSSNSGGCYRIGRIRKPARALSPVLKLTESLAGLKCDEWIAGGLVGLSDTSRVYSVVGSPHLVVKYQASRSKNMHSLVREHHFLGQLAGLNLAPQSYSLSGVPWEEASELWGRSRELPQLDPKAFVYRIVMDYAGRSLRDRMRDGKLFPSTAFDIAANLVQVLARLHQEGKVVHGDIHVGNVVVDSNKDKTHWNVHLIDFGRSEYLTDAPQSEESRSVHPHEMFSPWELRGLRRGPRDDLFRALLVLAYLLSGVQEASKHFRLSDWGNAVFQKSTESIFRFCTGLRPEVYDRLDALTNAVRANELHYEDIMDTLRELATHTS